MKQMGVTQRARAVVPTVAVLVCGSVSVTACSGGGDEDRGGAQPRECQTSSLELDEVRPATSPRRAVLDLLVVPGDSPSNSPVQIDDVVELADDRARVDVTAGSWEGGYELERRSGGWVLVAGISCGDPLECSDLATPNSTDAYFATLCSEETD